MSLKSSSSSCSDISIDEIQSREETGMLMTEMKFFKFFWIGIIDGGLVGHSFGVIQEI